jgi:hypothetical protein
MGRPVVVTPAKLIAAQALTWMRRRRFHSLVVDRPVSGS